MRREFRIRKSADFQKVRQEGRSFSHHALVYLSLVTNNQQVRIGIAAGKTIGNAVVRNKAKRLLRAAIRPLLEELETGRDIVLIARAVIINEKSNRLQEIIHELAKKSGDLKNL